MSFGGGGSLLSCSLSLSHTARQARPNQDWLTRRPSRRDSAGTHSAARPDPKPDLAPRGGLSRRASAVARAPSRPAAIAPSFEAPQHRRGHDPASAFYSVTRIAHGRSMCTPTPPPRPGHRHTNRSLLVRAGRRRAGEKGESSVGRRRRADSTKSGRDQGTARGEDLDPRHARPLSPPQSDAALLKPFAPDVNPRALSSARLAPRTETVHGAGACAVHRPPPPLILGSHEALRVCDCYLRCTKAATHALEKSTSKGCSHHLAHRTSLLRVEKPIERKDKKEFGFTISRMAKRTPSRYG